MSAGAHGDDPVAVVVPGRRAGGRPAGRPGRSAGRRPGAPPAPRAARWPRALPARVVAGCAVDAAGVGRRRGPPARGGSRDTTLAGHTIAAVREEQPGAHQRSDDQPRCRGGRQQPPQPGSVPGRSPPRGRRCRGLLGEPTEVGPVMVWMHVMNFHSLPIMMVRRAHAVKGRGCRGVDDRRPPTDRIGRCRRRSRLTGPMRGRDDPTRTRVR